MERSILDKYFKIAVLAAIFIYTLHVLKSIFAPLAMAMLLALIVLPLAKQLERWKVNRVLSAFLATFSIILIVGSLGVLAFFQFKDLASDFPRLAGELTDRVNNLIARIPQGLLPEGVRELEDLTKLAPKFLSSQSAMFGSAIGATTGLIAALILIPVYMVLILLYRGKMVRFVRVLDERRNSDLSRATLEAKEVAQSYLSGLGWVILIIATLNSTGLWIIGIKYALFFGVLSALLTVIPYVGTTLGATIPVLFALLTKDSYWYAVAVAGLYMFVQFLEGNFITPFVVGRAVNINPLAAILSLLLAAQLWGIIGMIIAIPMMAMFEIVLQHSRDFNHFTIILRNKDPDDD